MKHLLSILIAIGCFTTAFGKNIQSVDDTQNDSTQVEILKELKALHQFQVEEQKQRNKDIIEWRNSQRVYKGNEESPSDIGMMAIIEGNTRQHPLKDGWNLYGWIAILVAIFSAMIAMITFQAQSKTEQHTKNAPLSVQIGRFKDLTRHLYRNLVCTSAAIAKYNSTQNFISIGTAKKKNAKQKEEDAIEGAARVSFPSESNFNKLKTMPDDVVLNIDVNERTYAQMHELKVLLRNYNIEIDVASSHVSNKHIWKKAINQDFDNLIFKPLHLIKSAFETEKLMLSTESGRLPLPDRSIYIILEEHFDKLRSNIKALGYLGSFEILKELMGDQGKEASATKTGEVAPKCALEYYMSKIDATKALKRAIDNFIKEAKNYNSSLVDPENNNNLKIHSKAFYDYLDDRDAQMLKDIQGRLKETQKLLKAKERSLLWPVERERKKEEISLINASIAELEYKFKKESEKDPGKKLSSFIKKLISAKELETFKTIVNYEENDPPHVDIVDLHKQICPYIDYIAKEDWDFRELLYVLLAIDSTIEVNRIGMVNYA